MSILIRNMEMPKKCLDCPFMISRDNDDCILQSDEANAKFNSWNDMKASCPLIELPPHGRLIDADILKEVLERNFGHTGGASVLAQLIDARPTVIEAEGSETE